MKQISRFIDGVSSSSSKKLNSFIITVLLVSLNPSPILSQVVSHELRRLALASNQFGIDALRALDKIEPADRVIVFCPICLSSSFAMIMMGSSKHQVVSSLRHALYVWSMKPQEINRGYRDIFDYIGLNQQTTPQSELSKNVIRRSVNNSTEELIRPKSELMKKRASRLESYDANEHLSLPRLIRLKEILEKTDTIQEPWWNIITGRSDGNLKRFKELSQRHNNISLSTNELYPHLNITTMDQLDTKKDMCQMSATSNIYIQRGLILNYNYNLLLRQYYKTISHPVDFNRNGEETRQHINSIISSNTEGKIKDLVGKSSSELYKSTKLLLISTFHFRGTLDINLKDISLSVNSSKHSAKSSINNNNLEQIDSTSKRANTNSKRRNFIETEEAIIKHGTFTDYDCSVMEIPFNNRLVSLVIIMANNMNSTELLLTKLSGRILNDMINSLIVKKISIEIPIIKFDRNPINVEGLLNGLGLENLFYGNIAYSTETGLNRYMRPTDILHESSIDIGTLNPKWPQTEDRLKVGAHEDRAKSTRKRGRRESQRNHMKIDKPFLYFVLDSINGLVLTMGRVRQ